MMNIPRKLFFLVSKWRERCKMGMEANDSP